MSNIICGESLSVLKTMPDNSVDSIVTDPPFTLVLQSWYNEFMRKSTQITLVCANCNQEFKRYKSKVRSVNSFCTFECKNTGQSNGLVAPQRLGTGAPQTMQMQKRKYYKYRVFDKKRGYKTVQGGVWKFVDMLNECSYCGDTYNLGLDRISNSDGHHKDNTVVCCHRCNMARGDRFTVDEMKQLGKVIRNFK